MRPGRPLYRAAPLRVRTTAHGRALPASSSARRALGRPRGGAALSRPSSLQGCDFFFSFSKTRSLGRRGRFRGPAPRPFLLVGDGREEVGRPGRTREQARESLSLHVTRRRGNPHSRPLTQMTIFGNVRQWNRPRTLRPRGVEEFGENAGGLGAPIVRGPRSPTFPASRLPRAGYAAGVSVTASEAGRRAPRPPSPLPSCASSSSSLSRASSPAASSAPPSKVESKVDVSGSTWCGAGE